MANFNWQSTGIDRGPIRDWLNGPTSYAPRQVDTPILQLTFVPLDPCDVNRDGACDADDIDAMTQMLIDGTATHHQRTALIVGSYTSDDISRERRRVDG